MTQQEINQAAEKHAGKSLEKLCDTLDKPFPETLNFIADVFKDGEFTECND